MQKSKPRKTEKSNKIYLDYASSVSPNASSIHGAGVEVKINLEEARSEVAHLLGARAEEIIFTSGGTESNNLAIQGIVQMLHKNNFFSGPRTGRRSLRKNSFVPHIVTTNIEHASVLETFKMLEKRKLAQISIVPVEQNGIVDVRKIKKAIKKNTVLVSVMYANNEIGTIQPIRDIAREIRHYNKQAGNSNHVFFHTDAVQAVNYLDLNVERLGVDMLTISGSKIEGSGRVGLLYKKKSVPLVNIWGGGDQEFGLRPGTENVSEVLKFAKALKFTQKIKDKENARLKKLQDYFISKLPENFKLNGDLSKRLPNNINITVPNIPSDLLIIELSARGIMASAKSACKSGDGKASHVIQAINPNMNEMDGSIRFSFGRATTKKDIDLALRALSEILKKLNKWYR